MQYKPSSKSVEGHSLAALGFASLENSELDTDCVPHAEDVPFLFEQTDEKNAIGSAFFSKFPSRLLWPALQSSSWSCLIISTTPRAPGWGDETRKGCEAAAALGEVRGNQRQWDELEVIKFGCFLWQRR